MSDRQQANAAERERKNRIRRARVRLDDLPETDRAAVIAAAEDKELAARDAGSRRAHIAFVEDALVVREVAGRAVAAYERGKPMDAAAVARAVQEVSREVRGDVGDPALREQALEEAGRRGVLAGQTGVPVQRARRGAREVRGEGADRQEKCPACGEWKPAPADAAGEYVREADYRKGRSDCRACYNKRWRDGQAARKAATAGAK